MMKKHLINLVWISAIILMGWPKSETSKAQDDGTVLSSFRRHIHPIHDCFSYDDWYDNHPVWSPDSKEFIFGDLCSSNWKVYDTSQKQLYDDTDFPLLSYHTVDDTLKTRYGMADGFEAHTRYSPDGHYMVYVSNVTIDVVIEGTFSAHLLALADLQTGESQTMDFIVEPFTDATEFDVIWSDDGTAFSMNHYAWSYSPSYVVVNGYDKELANAQLQGMSYLQLPDQDYAVCRIFESSSDGEQWLLDVGPVVEGIYPCEIENRQLMIFDPNEPASSVVIETKAAAARFFEADSLLAVTSDGLVTIDIDSAQSQIINADLDTSWIDWGWFSPDGEWLAFAQSRPDEYASNLYIVNGQTGLPTILANMPPPSNLIPITPENATRLQPIAIYSDPSRAEFSNINSCSLYHVTLSPNGEWLVNIGYDEICVLNISQADSQWRILPTPETMSEIVGWAIRPDSQELAYVAANKIDNETRYAVYIVNLESGVQRTLVENQEQELRIVLSPDNATAAIYTFDDRDTRIAFVAIDTGLTIGTVPIESRAISIAFNRDGSQVIVFDYDSIYLNPQLQRVDVNTLTISQTSQYEGHGTILLSLGSDLYFAGFFGNSGQWVTDLPFIPNLQPIRDFLSGDAKGKWDNLIISPDGELLTVNLHYYEDGGGVYLCDTRTGSQLTILANGWQSNLSFSADNRYLLTDTYGGVQLWGIPGEPIDEAEQSPNG